MFELLFLCIPVAIIGMIVRYRATYHPRIQGSISPSEKLSSLETGQDAEPTTPEKEITVVSDLTESPTLLGIAKRVWKEDVRLLFLPSFTLLIHYSQQFEGIFKGIGKFRLFFFLCKLTHEPFSSARNFLELVVLPLLHIARSCDVYANRIHCHPL